MAHVISKDFSFCFGHRVWSQKLHADLSENAPCKCRHLHGHEAKVTAHLSSEKLTAGMVTDFNNLAWFKTFLDQTLDHKFVLDSNDPLFDTLTLGYSLAPVVLSEVGLVGHQLDSAGLEDCAMKEYLDSFFIVDFVPTSENFSRWLFDIVKAKLAPIGVVVSALEWWESPKSRAVFTGGDA